METSQGCTSKRVDDRKRVGRRRREMYVPATVIPLVVFQGGEAMVRAWNSVTSKTHLVEWPKLHKQSSYAARAFVFATFVSYRPYFQDDNTRHNQACIVDDFLHAKNVNRMVWRAISLDLSCIEHGWDVLGRAVSECLEQNSTLQDLRCFVEPQISQNVNFTQ